MAWPTGPGSPNQNSAPTTIAQPSRNRPMPSRRSAGSRSATAADPAGGAADAVGEAAPEGGKTASERIEDGPCCDGLRRPVAAAAADAQAWLGRRGRRGSLASGRPRLRALGRSGFATRPRWGRRAGRHGREAT